MSAESSRTAAGDRNARLSALLARVALADQRAFEEVYRLTGAHLYGVVLRIVRDKSIAEEILQESYVNVWHHAGTYDAARSQPFTWLTSIVRNRALDLKRRREIDTIAFDHGLSHGELAAHLREPLGTVKSWVRRGLEKLRRCLDAAGAAE
jgi:RNA polymerase sigma-70 factor (ECF subfamily)